MWLSLIENTQGTWGPFLFNAAANTALVTASAALVASVVGTYFDCRIPTAVAFTSLAILSGYVALTSLGTLAVISAVGCLSAYASPL